MKLPGRRVIGDLRPGPRPRPPEGLLDRLKEDVPQELFSESPGEDRSPAGQGRLVRWAVAASLLLVGLSGLLAVRFLQQGSQRAWPPTTAEREIEEVPAMEQAGRDRRFGADAASVARGEGRLEEEAEQPPAAAAPPRANDESGARAELRAQTKALPEQDAAASPPSLPSDSPRPPPPAADGARARAPTTPAEEQQESTSPVREVRRPQEALSDRADRSRSLDRDAKRAAAEVAASRLGGVESKGSAQTANEDERRVVAPLTLEELRWQNHTLLIRGRAAVDGELEIRLVGTGRTETRRVESGKSFEFGLDDVGEARRLELRLVGWGETWTHEIPSP